MIALLVRVAPFNYAWVVVFSSTLAIFACLGLGPAAGGMLADWYDGFDSSYWLAAGLATLAMVFATTLPQKRD